MKKLLLTLMLAVVSSSAIAEWIEVSSSDDLGITVYSDPAILIKSGNTGRL